MNYNYIEETKKIIHELKESGNLDLANKVEDILYNTFIQIELLVDLRHLLRNDDTKVISIATFSKIKKLLEWIDQTVGPYKKE
ncbi:MAG: hypothetical protein QE271_06010 [Bacteriovoracaceae bacterium]|nr:hypothetical protein [Bacteriovoracaceae bacterium]